MGKGNEKRKKWNKKRQNNRKIIDRIISAKNDMVKMII